MLAGPVYNDAHRGRILRQRGVAMPWFLGCAWRGSVHLAVQYIVRLTQEGGICLSDAFGLIL